MLDHFAVAVPLRGGITSAIIVIIAIIVCRIACAAGGSSVVGSLTVPQAIRINKPHAQQQISGYLQQYGAECSKHEVGDKRYHTPQPNGNGGNEPELFYHITVFGELLQGNDSSYSQHSQASQENEKVSYDAGSSVADQNKSKKIDKADDAGAYQQ